MKEERYFIQPDDHAITFDLPLSLAEIKTLYNSVVSRYNAYYQAGSICRPQEELMLKLESVIIYLQLEHYSHP